MDFKRQAEPARAEAARGAKAGNVSGDSDCQQHALDNLRELRKRRRVYFFISSRDLESLTASERRARTSLRVSGTDNVSRDLRPGMTRRSV